MFSYAKTNPVSFTESTDIDKSNVLPYVSNILSKYVLENATIADVVEKPVVTCKVPDPDIFKDKLAQSGELSPNFQIILLCIFYSYEIVTVEVLTNVPLSCPSYGVNSAYHESPLVK